MPMSVRLDPKTDRAIARLAKRRGQTKSEVVREAIGVLTQQTKAGEQQQPYYLIAHLIGCVDSGGARLSERTGEKFANLLREKAHARRSR
jgi:predicted DNA-binding protein